MNEYLRDRIMRKLDTLSDERLYQVLDYVEFLESRYAERPAAPTNIFQRFSETVEDRLRSGRVSAQTIAETMGLMNRAMSVLGGVAAAGASVAKDVKDVVDAAVTPPPRSPREGSGGTSSATARGESASPQSVPQPRDGASGSQPAPNPTGGLPNAGSESRDGS
jgi:hypothetical protein